VTQRFLNFIGFVIDHEGTTYENDPDDPGGATKYGIDQRSHPNVDIKSLSEEEAKAIYYSEWQADRCESLAVKLGESHFDACVNCGSGRSSKFLAASHNDPSKYNDERESFYHRLAAARPISAKFLRGWLRRVSDLRQFLNI
jgi:lysozyme family protein